MTLYAFKFCPCTYESASTTVSVHKTLSGAYIAMKKHRLSAFWDWREKPNQYRKISQDTFAKDWYVQKIEVLD